MSACWCLACDSDINHNFPDFRKCFCTTEKADPSKGRFLIQTWTGILSQLIYYFFFTSWATVVAERLWCSVADQKDVGSVTAAAVTFWWRQNARSSCAVLRQCMLKSTRCWKWSTGLHQSIPDSLSRSGILISIDQTITTCHNECGGTIGNWTNN